MVDYSGLENRRAERHRGFESLSLRKAYEGSQEIGFLFLLIFRGVSYLITFLVLPSGRICMNTPFVWQSVNLRPSMSMK